MDVLLQKLFQKNQLKTLNSLILLSLLISCTTKVQPYVDCRFPSHSPFPGGVVNIKVKSSDINYQAEDTEIDSQLLCKESSTEWRIIKPIPLSSKEKTIRININHNAYQDISITKKEYRVSKIQITNNEYIAPSMTNVIRASKERAIIKETIGYNSGLHFFSNLRMKLPVNGLISSGFGVKRFINGSPRNPHLGTDIPADIGTPIKAPLSGKIMLVGNFFYRGKVIFIDHGKGLISSYSHLNDVYVKKDQEIISGTVLGEVGKTGRVTGPHLHWQVYLKGISVDPEVFLP